MSTLLAIGLANAIGAALLAVPAYLVSRHGRRPALAHALWLLVLLKLVTPPLWRPAFAWLPAEEAPVTAVAAPEPIAAAPLATRVAPVEAPGGGPIVFARPAEPRPVAPLVLAPAVFEPAPPPEAPAPVADAPGSPPVADAPGSPGAPDDRGRGALVLLLAVWLGGAVFWLLRSLHYVARFSRLLRHARLAPSEIQQEAHAVASRFGLRRCPPVVLVPGAIPPMVWGVGRVRILFPTGLLEHLGPEERASLFAHELAHVARRDHWVRWLELAALSLFWWYPLAWWARGRMLQHEEECCDAWAAGESSPRAYAAAILEAVDFLAGAKPRLPAAASPLAGVASLKRRLTLILTETPPRQLGWLTWAAVILVAAAALPLVPTLAPAQRPAAQPRAEKDEEPLPEATELAPNPVDLLAVRDAFSVRFSPDGKHLAVGVGEFQRPGEVQLFDVRSRQSLWRVGEPYGVASVDFTADGKGLAWSGWGGLLRGRDVRGVGGQLALPLPGRNNRLAHSPDGKWLAVAGEDRTLQLRQPRAGKFLRALQGELTDFYCLNWSPDSKLLAAGGGYFERDQGNFAVVFDVANNKQVAKLEGHTRAVLNVAFAPKADLIATASYDSTVRLYEGKSFKFKVALRGHTGGVKGLAFSPDGALLATGSFDRTVRLWGVADGKEIARFEGHPLRVREVAFSPDGALLASVGGQEAVKLWDIKARKEAATLRLARAGDKALPTPVAMALSADGRSLALGLDDGQVIIRDGRTARARLTLKAHADAVTALAFSRDGTRLATGGPDAVVKVWDAASGKEVRAFKGHTSWVYSLTFAPDGKRLASGSYDRTVRLWPLDGGAMRTLSGHRGSVRALVFTPDGKALFSGGGDRAIRRWDLQTFTSQAVLRGHAGTVRGLVFADGGQVLISAAEDGVLKRWDAVKNVELTTRLVGGELRVLTASPLARVVVSGNDSGGVTLHNPADLTQFTMSRPHGLAPVYSLAYGPGGQQLFTLGGDGALKRFDAVPSPVRHLAGHKGPVRVAVFSPDGRLAASCGGWPEGDKTLRLWEVATGKPLRVLESGKRQVESAAFSPDGKHVAAGGDDGHLNLWEVSSGKLVRQFKGHAAGSVAQVTFSGDGQSLLSVGNDKTVRLWDVDSGAQKQVFTGHTDWARAAIFLPDGKHVLSGGRDKAVRLWRIADGELVKTITQPDVVEALAATRDGGRWLVGGGNFVRAYGPDTGGLLALYSGHVGGVTSLALAKDDRTFWTSSYDGSVRAWDMQTSVQARRLGGHRDWVWSVALSPDGKHVLTAGGGGRQNDKWVPGSDFAIRVWRVPAVGQAFQPAR